MHRRKLQVLSPAERTDLANLVISYVTPAVIQEHTEWHSTHGPGGMMCPGSGERFLAFRRKYLGRLRDWPTARLRLVSFLWSPGTQRLPYSLNFPHPQKYEQSEHTTGSFALFWGG